jgi:hypothetical protein
MRELFHYLELIFIALCLAFGVSLVYGDTARRGPDLALISGAILCALAFMLLPGAIRTRVELRNWKRRIRAFEKESSTTSGPTVPKK